MAEYYVRQDGGAANKAAATSPDPEDKNTYMNLSTMMAELNYDTGDIIHLSTLDGDYTETLAAMDTAGFERSVTITNVAGESSLPRIVVTGANYGIDQNRNNQFYTFSNMVIDASGGSVYAVYSQRSTTLDNVTVIGNSSAVAVQVQNSNNECVITDCDVSGGTVGVRNASTTESFEMSDTSIHDCTENGVLISKDGSIEGCTVYDNGQSGISVNGAAVVTIDDTEVYGNAIDGVTIASSAVVTCTGVTSHSHQGVLVPGYGDGFTAHETSTLNLHNCFSYGNIKGVTVVEDSAGEIINCIFYNNYDPLQTNLIFGNAYGAGIILYDKTGGHWDINNNICQNNELEIAIDYNAVTTATTTSDYNCLYNERGGNYAYYFDGTFRADLADFKTDSSGDANSIDSDPLMADPANADFTISFSSPTIAASIAEIAYAPQSMTTALLVTMGAASTELTAQSETDDQNVLTCDDTKTSLLFFTNTDIVKSTDGATPTSEAGSWAKYDEVLLIVQVRTDTDYYRVGRSVNGAAIDWQTQAAYGGSFDPLDDLRFALGLEIPMHVKQLQVWNKEASDAEILGML